MAWIDTQRQLYVESEDQSQRIEHFEQEMRQYREEMENSQAFVVYNRKEQARCKARIQELEMEQRLYRRELDEMKRANAEQAQR
ncbi:hypothetical protein BGX33_000268 [Mortierella sp. NVP41]|nr:hypothetical protein BGX33_000268 [Mortierella sp. NVP41]